MTRTILLASAASLALGGGALAADLPARVQAPAPAFVPPVFTWTGFYAGVNAGVGFNAGDDRDSVLVLPGGATLRYGDNYDDAAFTGGGQIGFNYQLRNNVVLGAEADLQFLGLDDDDMVSPTIVGTPPGGAAFDPARRGVTGIDWFGTLRLRAGYAFDRTLVYATGGLAYGEGEATEIEAVRGTGGFVDDEDVSFGWTLGGGVEYAWTDNLIVGIEGLYVSIDRDYDSNRFAGVDASTTPPTAVFAVNEDGDDDIEFGVVRARLNYKF